MQLSVHVGCCRDREAVGEDGGKLAVNEREGSTKGGRPSLVGRHLLKIQELSQTLPGCHQKEKLLSKVRE